MLSFIRLIGDHLGVVVEEALQSLPLHEPVTRLVSETRI